MSTRTAAASRATFAALLGLLVSACVDSTLVPEPATLGISTSADSLLSDGLASVVVAVEIPRSLPQYATVEFTTSLGRWANPGGAPDRKVLVEAQGRVAEARLFAAGEVGTAYITVNSAGATAHTTVELSPSLPDTIDLSVDRTAALANGATVVTATAVLRRVAGTVSRGTPVRFEVRDSATRAPLPELGGVVLVDSSGTAKISLTSTVSRTVFVQAYAGAARSDERTVRFTPPPAPVVAGGTVAPAAGRGVISPLSLLEGQ